MQRQPLLSPQHLPLFFPSVLVCMLEQRAVAGDTGGARKFGQLYRQCTGDCAC